LLKYEYLKKKFNESIICHVMKYFWLQSKQFATISRDTDIDECALKEENADAAAAGADF
jgi:hypothetical protein